MATISIRDTFVRASEELTKAHIALSDAADWTRSDWSDRRELTDDEAAACAEVLVAVHYAKVAIERAKNHVDRVTGR